MKIVRTQHVKASTQRPQLACLYDYVTAVPFQTGQGACQANKRWSLVAGQLVALFQCQGLCVSSLNAMPENIMKFSFEGWRTAEVLLRSRMAGWQVSYSNSNGRRGSYFFPCEGVGVGGLKLCGHHCWWQQQRFPATVVWSVNYLYTSELNNQVSE